MTIGDLGADVIKVERSGPGDESRGWGPPFDERGESAYYLSANRNKLSIGLDLENDSDRAVLARLVRGADAVLDNFRPGTLERFGLDPAGFLDESPKLIWCTLTGFGKESMRPGYDFVVQAESGWMSITGEPDREPMKVGVALADVMAGKDAAIAILAGLRAVADKPVPASERRIWISLAHSATAALINVAQNYLVSGSHPKRWGNAHPNLVPYQLFQAADRGLVIAVGNDAQWLQCCAALGLGELADAPELRTNRGRLEQRARVVSAIRERVSSRTADDWRSELGRLGVPCGIVRSVAEALADVSASPLTGVAPSVPGSVRFQPPRHDEHGELIRLRGWAAFRHVTPLGLSRHAT
jgi:crotonobetainyl-CoA:carnitine CoA-transferase CaiB-like acyl-CoA transferase